MTDESGRKSLAARLAVSAMVAVAVALSGSAGADSSKDHDRARAALDAGEILPLSSILDRVGSLRPGRILEVELERKDSGWVYEIKMLLDGGTLAKLKVDARDGSILSEKPRRGRDGR